MSFSVKDLMRMSNSRRPSSSIGKKSPFRKGAIKGDRGPFYGVRGGCFSQAKTGEKTVFSAPFSGHLTS